MFMGVEGYVLGRLCLWPFQGRKDKCNLCNSPSYLASSPTSVRWRTSFCLRVTRVSKLLPNLAIKENIYFVRWMISKKNYMYVHIYICDIYLTHNFKTTNDCLFKYKEKDSQLVVITLLCFQFDWIKSFLNLKIL